MIRSGRTSDIADVLELVVAAGLFEAEEVGLVEEMLGAYFDGGRDKGHGFLVVETDGGLDAVAYYEPWRGAERVWNLTMIAVRPERQGTGVGRTLLSRVEVALREDGQRLLLVETSGLPGFAQARGFYTATGYDEEARVRDHWTDGDDMVLFRKALQA